MGMNCEIQYRKGNAKMLAVLLFLCALVPAHWPAQAWDAEKWYETSTALPASIQEALPKQSAYVCGIGAGDTIFVLLDEGGDIRRVSVFADNGNSYRLECASAPFPRWNGIAPTIGGSGDTLHVIYEAVGGASFTFKRMRDHTWKLRTVQAKDTYSFDAVGLYENGEPYLCGSIGDSDLSAVDVSKLPATYAEAVQKMDTDGWALVKSGKYSDRLHLRTAPSTDAASIGRYYSGTPVRVLAEQGDWAKVSVAGVQGYMLKKFLAFGLDMLNVHRWFLSSVGESKTLIVEDAERGVNVHAGPDTGSAIVGVLRESDSFSQYIIATVGDHWYHILCNDGLSGYVEARHFCDGNG